MIPGIFLIAIGIAPLALGHFTDFALEFAASIVFFGLLLFLIGWLMRKVRKGFESAYAPPTSAGRKQTTSG